MTIAAVILISALFVTGIVGLSLSGPRYRGESSDHFDGLRFFNPDPTPSRGFLDMMRWVLTKDSGEWGSELASLKNQTPQARVAAPEPRFMFIGHATWLIQWNGLNILTDPIWAERAGPFGFTGPVRKQAPGLAFDALPPIDVVLVSHNHYDHLDLSTLKRLEGRDHPRIFTGLGNAAFLRNAGISDVVEQDWWQTTSFRDALDVSFVPARHFSQRGSHDRNRTLWGGFVLSSKQGLRVFFAGDTGYAPHFKAIRERYGAMDVALLPIGAFKPRWFMAAMHMGPEEALSAHRDLGAAHTLAMHYGVFDLADDGRKEATNLLASLIDQEAALRGAVHIVPFGGTWTRPSSRSTTE